MCWVQDLGTPFVTSPLLIRLTPFMMMKTTERNAPKSLWNPCGILVEFETCTKIPTTALEEAKPIVNTTVESTWQRKIHIHQPRLSQH